jgi:hypothetical protein
MRIRIESEGTWIETTFGRWLETLRSVAESDAEFAAVLGCMLDDGRIRFLSEKQQTLAA